MIDEKCSQLFVQVNFTSNCNYDYEMFYLDDIINYSQTNLCPDLVKSEVSEGITISTIHHVRSTNGVHCTIHFIPLSSIKLMYPKLSLHRNTVIF